jgi:hypothetical protein
MSLEPWYRVVTPRQEVREGCSFSPDKFAIALDARHSATTLATCILFACYNRGENSQPTQDTDGRYALCRLSPRGDRIPRGSHLP